MAGGPLKKDGVSIPLIVSDGKRIISDQKIATDLFRQNLVDVTAACLGPMVETKYFPALAKSALTGIGDLKQNDTDGWQYYVAILDRSTGKITKMGLPCVTTESGEKIFPSATDLKPEDLAGYARNLPPGFEIAVVLRYDRGMTDDISVNEGTSFASLSAPNPSPVQGDVLASTRMFQQRPESMEMAPKAPANINEQKCVACGGDASAKIEGPVAPRLKIFLGDQEMPVTLDGVSDLTPGNSWRRSADAMTDRFQRFQLSMPAILAGGDSRSSLYPIQSSYRVREKCADPFPEQIREVVLSCILFSVKSASQALVVGDPALMISQVRIPVPKGARADGRIMKGILSIVETDQCPSSRHPMADSGRRIEFLGTPERMIKTAEADYMRAGQNKIDETDARIDRLARTAGFAQPLHERLNGASKVPGKTRDIRLDPHHAAHAYSDDMHAPLPGAHEASRPGNRLTEKKRRSDRSAQRKSDAFGKKTFDPIRKKVKQVEDAVRAARFRRAKDAETLRTREVKKRARQSYPSNANASRNAWTASKTPKEGSHGASARHGRSKGIGKTDRSGSYRKTRSGNDGRRSLPGESAISMGRSIAKESKSLVSASRRLKPEIPDAMSTRRPAAHPKAGLSKPGSSPAQIEKRPAVLSARISRRRKNMRDLLIGLFNGPKKRRKRKRSL